MKKRIFIIVFLFTTVVPNASVLAEHTQQNAKQSQYTELQVQKILPKPSKKMLKKELKRKKRFHRSLVAKYNETFNEKYLELIQTNSEKISELWRTIA